MDCFAHLAHVFGSGATASANNSDSQVAHMVTMKFGELFGREVVMGFAINNAGKSSIG